MLEAECSGNSTTEKAEAGRSLQEQGQPETHKESLSKKKYRRGTKGGRKGGGIGERKKKGRKKGRRKDVFE